MTIYAMSRTRHAPMWIGFRARGIPIISTWMDEKDDNLTVLWSRIVAEMRQARQAILYVEPLDFPLKGALVEVGIALAFNVPVSVVSPGIELDERYRPLGSWVTHPLVSFYDTLDTAFGWPR